MATPVRAFDVTLSAEEWSLVSGLRTVPDSPLKARLLTLVETLLHFVAEPKCAQMQADGVPCTSASAQCEECLQVAALLEELTRRALRTSA
jgi:hypothetical protein